MTRRRAVVLGSAMVLGIIGVVILVGIVMLTQSPYGRDLVRQVVESQLRGAVQGRVHIGTVGGNLLTGVTIDSIEIRDPSDSIFVATGQIRVHYDPRDLLDRRLIVSRLEVHRPVVRITRGADRQWNFRRIFGRRSPGAPPRPRGSLGELIVANNVIIHDGEFTLAMPWQPDRDLTGAARDSAIAYGLQREDEDIRVADSGYVRRRYWTNIDARLAHARIAHPDSAGLRFVISSMDVIEFDPPFQVSGLVGDVQVRGDSVLMDVAKFNLPGSTGSGHGRIWWGSDLPVRYDIHVRGDSVSLADVAWIDSSIPREGSGSTLLHIRNNRDNLRILEFALSEMDVRSHESHVRGSMTFGNGAPSLLITDVDLDMEPMDFRLLEAFAGRPFPLPWRGTITGNVRGRGGPVERFRLDSSYVVFADANVPGATARGSARGVVDISDPANPVFRGVAANVDAFDLRTAQFLNPAFPRLRGTVSGQAVLDSVWTDVRVSDATITHMDGSAPRTTLTGGGRVTLGETYVAYELDMLADSISYSVLAASYPGFPLRGNAAGPLWVAGTIADMELAGRLSGPAGALEFNTRLDSELPSYAASGVLDLDDVDLSALLDRLDVPASRVAASIEGSVRGSSMADLEGNLNALIFESLLDQIPVDAGGARMTFANGIARVDTLHLSSSVAKVEASGGIGLARHTADSLLVRVATGSLDAWRGLMGAPATSSDAGGDSLSGDIRLDMTFAGTLAPPEPGSDSGTLGVRATLAVRDLDMPELRAAAVDGTARFSDLRGSPSGTVSLNVDSARVGRYSISSAQGNVRFDGSREGRITLGAQLTSRASVHGSAAVLLSGNESMRVYVDSLAAMVRSPAGDERTWRLERPALLASTRVGFEMDTLALRGPDGARLLAAGVLPVIDSLNAVIIAERVPLRDVGAVAQIPVPLDGAVTMTFLARGVRDAPRYVFDGRTIGARVGEVQTDELRIRGEYERRRLSTDLVLARADNVLVRARTDVPVDLAIVPRSRRVLYEPLSGYIQANRVDLSALETFTSAIRNASGTFTIDARLNGTPASPRMNGSLAVNGGALDIPQLGTVRLRDLNADVQFLSDSVDVRGVTAASGSQRLSSLLLRGGIGFSPGDLPRLGLELQLQNFHVVGRPRLADLDVSTTPNLRLRGPLDALVLTGGVRVERGTVYLPELSGKQLIALDDPELYTIVDTTRAENRTLLPAAPSTVTNLTLRDVEVVMGDEVWLRGPEANVILGGRLSLTTTPAGTEDISGRPVERLALLGALTADRGTYRLNLGVVQRTFEIEQGTVRFFGESEFNPGLDIRGLYTVHRVDPRAAQPDVRIRATIGGTLADPELSIGGADDARITESDALSYLVLGVPSLQVGGVQQSNQHTATALAISSIGSYLTDRAAGGLFDYVTFQTGGLDAAESGFGDASQTLLAGSRLGLGLQVSDRAFVSLQAGLCQVVDAAYGRGFRATDFAGSLGVKLDYRLSQALIFSAGVEPGASALYCRTTDAARGFAPTPQQWTFDLFRTWRF